MRNLEPTLFKPSEYYLAKMMSFVYAPVSAQCMTPGKPCYHHDVECKEKYRGPIWSSSERRVPPDWSKGNATYICYRVLVFFQSSVYGLHQTRCSIDGPVRKAGRTVFDRWSFRRRHHDWHALSRSRKQCVRSYRKLALIDLATRQHAW
jgi:hypothetical protein